MSDFFNLFVSPHAISQFQERIAPTDQDKARRIIQAGILQSANRKLIPPKGKYPATWRIRTRRPFPFEFRAYVVFDQQRGQFVVTTIVRGDGSVARKRRRKEKENKSHEQ